MTTCVLLQCVYQFMDDDVLLIMVQVCYVISHSEFTQLLASSSFVSNSSALPVLAVLLSTFACHIGLFLIWTVE